MLFPTFLAPLFLDPCYMYLHVHLICVTCTYMYTWSVLHVLTCTLDLCYMYLHVHLIHATCTYMYTCVICRIVHCTWFTCSENGVVCYRFEPIKSPQPHGAPWQSWGSCCSHMNKDAWPSLPASLNLNDQLRFMLLIFVARTLLFSACSLTVNACMAWTNIISATRPVINTQACPTMQYIY